MFTLYTAGKPCSRRRTLAQGGTEVHLERGQSNRLTLHEISVCTFPKCKYDTVYIWVLIFNSGEIISINNNK